MMNYRRLTAMLLVSGLLTGAVAGCGSSTQTTDSGSGTTAQTAAQDDTFEILQTKDDGTIMGDYYVGSNEDTINWGRLPNRDTEPVLTVESGSTVTFSGRVWVGSRAMRSGRPVSAVGSRLLVTVTFTCAKTVLSPGT